MVNSFYQDFQALQATAKVYNLNMSEKYSHEGGRHPRRWRGALAIPEIQDPSPVYFVQLTLADATGKVVSSNFYWLSTKQPEFDWAKTSYINTPTTVHPDLTMLAGLPKATVEAQATLNRGAVRVRLHNPGKQLAFQVGLAVETKNGAEILPVLWDRQLHLAAAR